MTTPAAPASWYVEYARVPETIVPGKRLGRVVRHDSRNRLYPHQRSDRALTSQLWTRHIPILDQGNVGSCTGNMMTGALGTDPVYGALPPAHPALDESLALQIYSSAETLDGDGPYPPQDNGSSGPSVDQVAKNMGLISGYTHGFALADLLDALENGPLGIGINWYDSMDSPDSSGLVTISAGAVVRGGHEVLVRGKDITGQLIHCDNSWGTGFGVNGSFDMGYATIERLLSEQGDVTVPVPLTMPTPVPVPPPPPTPTPTPVPTPTPAPVADAADITLARAIGDWPDQLHAGSNKRVAQALEAWLAAKGLDTL